MESQTEKTNGTSSEEMLDSLDETLKALGKSIESTVNGDHKRVIPTIFATGAWFFRMVNDLIPHNERNSFVEEVFEFAMRSREQQDENIPSKG